MTRTRFTIRLLTLFSFLLLMGQSVSAQSTQKEKPQEPSVKVVHRVEPVYPDEAQREGVQGKVVLDVTVEANGEVSMATVVNGHRLLNQAAIDAVKQWRFTNTYNSPVTIQITFAFNDGDEPAPQESPSKPATDGALKSLHRVDALYPEEAKRKRVEGEVAVEIVVNKDGAVTDARVKSGDELLHKAALDAARQFRFSNSLQQTVAATLTFNFVLGDKDKSAPKKPML